MIVVLGIIEKEEQILIGKVKEDQIESFGGIKYIFPGGKVNDGENLKTAVEREVLEETGFVVKIIKDIHKRIHPITGKEIHYFHCIPIGGNENLNNPKNDDLEKLIWIEKSEIGEYMPTVNPEVLMYFQEKKA